jgi:hypothetical protein
MGDTPQPKRARERALDPPAQPALKGHDRGHAEEVEAHGALFVGAPRGTEVEQEKLGDCFFLAALASFAQRRPDEVRASIRPEGGGIYTVRFFRHDPATGQYEPKEVKVDRILPEEHGAPIYATTVNGQGLWVAIYEKAFAVEHHGYDVLDRGGDPAEAVAALTGRPARTTWLEHVEPHEVWEALDRAIAGQRVTLATTFTDAEARAMLARKRARGDAAAKAYDPATFTHKSLGLLPQHTYSVWRLEGSGHGDTPGAGRAVRLRNPWGHFEPPGDGRDDGMFSLPLTELTTLLANIIVGG